MGNHFQVRFRNVGGGGVRRDRLGHRGGGGWGGWNAAEPGEDNGDDAAAGRVAAAAGRQYELPKEGGGGVEERQGEGEAGGGEGGAHPAALSANVEKMEGAAHLSPVDVGAMQTLERVVGGVSARNGWLKTCGCGRGSGFRHCPGGSGRRGDPLR